MTKDERIQGLLEANNRNTMRCRSLATALRSVRDQLPANFTVMRGYIDCFLQLNGPE